MSWSRLLARVWSGPKLAYKLTTILKNFTSRERGVEDGKQFCWQHRQPMIGENRQLVTNEPVEFQK